jgi:hypothetical protein
VPLKKLTLSQKNVSDFADAYLQWNWTKIDMQVRGAYVYVLSPDSGVRSRIKISELPQNTSRLRAKIMVRKLEKLAAERESILNDLDVAEQAIIIHRTEE